jgi:hypothetical protein
MKTIIFIPCIVFVFLMGNFAKANESNECGCSNTEKLKTEISNIIEKYSAELNLESETALIQYEITENNTLLISEIQTSNEDLRLLIMKHMNGKKISISAEQCKSGLVRINYVATQQKEFFMY